MDGTGRSGAPMRIETPLTDSLQLVKYDSSNVHIAFMNVTMCPRGSGEASDGWTYIIVCPTIWRGSSPS